MARHVMRNIVTFQKTDDNVNYFDYYRCHAYINGLSGQEFFIANAGFDNNLTVEIECRYCPELMIISTLFRIVDESGNIYEIISPADDIQLRHKIIKFRARRNPSAVTSRR